MSTPRRLVLFVLFLSVLALDRWFKYLMLNNKLPSEGVYFISPNILLIKLFKNPYLAFSIPAPLFLIMAISLLAISLLVYLFIKNYKHHSLASGAIFLILLGAVSNFADRISAGAVIDYIHLFFLPIFNIADIMILSGIIFFLFAYEQKS